MMSGLLIRGGTIVNEGESYRGWIVVENERIARTGRGDYPRPEFDGETIDAEGMYVLPGVIDDQVHFREPGLTYKGDLHSESIAAAAGGVTSYMDMPNVKPPTVTNALLEKKSSNVRPKPRWSTTRSTSARRTTISSRSVASTRSGSAASSSSWARRPATCSSTTSVRSAPCSPKSPVPIAAHCEDEPTVRADMERFRTLYGESGLTAAMHPLIRSAEACLRSSGKAVSLAERYGGRLHVLHLSTARELQPVRPRGAARTKAHHLRSLRASPLVQRCRLCPKRQPDQMESAPSKARCRPRRAPGRLLLDGAVDVVATDHAPQHARREGTPLCERSVGRSPRTALAADDARTERAGRIARSNDSSRKCATRRPGCSASATGASCERAISPTSCSSGPQIHGPYRKKTSCTSAAGRLWKVPRSRTASCGRSSTDGPSTPDGRVD